MVERKEMMAALKNRLVSAQAQHAAEQQQEGSLSRVPFG